MSRRRSSKGLVSVTKKNTIQCGFVCRNSATRSSRSSRGKGEGAKKGTTSGENIVNITQLARDGPSQHRAGQDQRILSTSRSLQEMGQVSIGQDRIREGKGRGMRDSDLH